MRNGFVSDEGMMCVWRISRGVVVLVDEPRPARRAVGLGFWVVWRVGM